LFIWVNILRRCLDEKTACYPDRFDDPSCTVSQDDGDRDRDDDDSQEDGDRDKDDRGKRDKDKDDRDKDDREGRDKDKDDRDKDDREGRDKDKGDRDKDDREGRDKDKDDRDKDDREGRDKDKDDRDKDDDDGDGDDRDQSDKKCKKKDDDCTDTEDDDQDTPDEDEGDSDDDDQDTPDEEDDSNEKPKKDACRKIGDGGIYTRTVPPGGFGDEIIMGFDAFGYNYQAHKFQGFAENASRNIPTALEGKVYLKMKWNETYVSNKDCDGDHHLDLHYGYDSYYGTDAWLTNSYKWSYIGDDGEVHWVRWLLKATAKPNANFDCASIGASMYNSHFCWTVSDYRDPYGGSQGFEVLLSLLGFREWLGSLRRQSKLEFSEECFTSENQLGLSKK